eukprot:GHVR01052105.1.p1 GENE.GHVR01052105.1~~GHVR01052105.1.p1  ORF type:complete len:156 (+),score=30.63 GHVR01052105.1:2169-2636(+)
MTCVPKLYCVQALTSASIKYRSSEVRDPNDVCVCYYGIDGEVIWIQGVVVKRVIEGDRVSNLHIDDGTDVIDIVVADIFKDNFTNLPHIGVHASCLVVPTPCLLGTDDCNSFDVYFELAKISTTVDDIPNAESVWAIEVMEWFLYVKSTVLKENQ